MTNENNPTEYTSFFADPEVGDIVQARLNGKFVRGRIVAIRKMTLSSWTGETWEERCAIVMPSAGFGDSNAREVAPLDEWEIYKKAGER